MVDDCIKDKKDEVEEENRDVENRLGISGGTWYKDNNNKDMEELDKVIKFGKLVFYKKR